MRTNLNVLLVILASSYLTLGVFEPDKAASLWAVYAIATFLIATFSLYLTRVRK